jgi:hypothetical protein
LSDDSKITDPAAAVEAEEIARLTKVQPSPVPLVSPEEVKAAMQGPRDRLKAVLSGITFSDGVIDCHADDVAETLLEHSETVIDILRDHQTLQESAKVVVDILKGARGTR